jgi:hypothetical protein
MGGRIGKALPRWFQVVWIALVCGGVLMLSGAYFAAAPDWQVSAEVAPVEVEPLGQSGHETGNGRVRWKANACVFEAAGRLE